MCPLAHSLAMNQAPTRSRARNIERAAELQLRVRLLVASDARLLCEGLATALGARPGVEVLGAVLGEPAALREALNRRADVLILDMSMPQAMRLARRLRHARSSARTVLLIEDESVSTVLAVAEAGISGYGLRSGSVSQLLDVARSVAMGETPCPPRVTAGLFGRLAAHAEERHQLPERPLLTRRETEVVDLIEDGLSNRQIAQRLCIALPTVKNHVHRILAKLDVPGRDQAAALMRR